MSEETGKYAIFGFHNRDQAIEALCLKVFGARPFYRESAPVREFEHVQLVKKEVEQKSGLDISDETLEAIVCVTRGRCGAGDLDKIAQGLIDARRELAEVTKQRDHLADLLRRAKIYVHECPFKAQIIAALAAAKGGDA